MNNKEGKNKLIIFNLRLHHKVDTQMPSLTRNTSSTNDDDSPALSETVNQKKVAAKRALLMSRKRAVCSLEGTYSDALHKQAK